MKQLYIPLVLALLLSLSNTQAQSNRAIFVKTGNIQTAMPFSSFDVMFTEVFRPYIEVGYSLRLKGYTKSALWLDGHLGYFNHRFVQQALPLHVHLRYQHQIAQKTGLRASLGGGYTHAFPFEGRYRTNESGDYESVGGLGRAQAGFGLMVGASHKLTEKFELSLEYRILFQTPFVKSYVPLLPFEMLQLGLTYHLN
jgi:hypothetical protein